MQTTDDNFFFTASIPAQQKGRSPTDKINGIMMDDFISHVCKIGLRHRMEVEIVEGINCR